MGRLVLALVLGRERDLGAGDRAFREDRPVLVDELDPAVGLHQPFERRGRPFAEAAIVIEVGDDGDVALRVAADRGGRVADDHLAADVACVEAWRGGVRRRRRKRGQQGDQAEGGTAGAGRGDRHVASLTALRPAVERRPRTLSHRFRTAPGKNCRVVYAPVTKRASTQLNASLTN